MRIWVTGIGIVSPLGRDAPSTMAALIEGRRAFGALTLFDPSGCRSQIAAEVSGLGVREIASAEEAPGWSRTDSMAVIAGREALAQAGIEAETVDLVIGGTTAGMFETEALLAEMHRDPDARQPLASMLSHPLSATADRMRQKVAPFRQVRTLCSACSSGANALLLGASWLRLGRSRRVLAGGADALCRLTYTGFNCLGALDPQPCRPFDRDRAGLSLGEGAAFLLLETEEEARARGAQPIAELAGWAVGAEAHHITNPEASGQTAARVMRLALERAELSPESIDYVNAHGTATPLNDRMESAALHRCFGERAARLPVSSSKGQIGHTLGAAGAIEAAITAMALERGVLPPTAGLENVDPDCALEHLREARELPARAAMSNSFGFGGSDAVIVLTRPGSFERAAPPAPRQVYLHAAATFGALGLAGTSEARAAIAAGPPPAAGPAPFEAKEHLDLDRARRMDRAARLAATAMQRAWNDAGLPDDARARAGAILGEAFGSIDECSAFIRRFFDKGPKLASPAIFPNLLPSSPVAHASIYHRFGGAVWASADLGATSESAVVSAAELIAAGEADVMLAGGVEQASAITEAVLDPLLREGRAASLPRAEGTAVLLLSSARSGCELRWWAGWRGEPGDAFADLPAPDRWQRTALFVARDEAALRRLAEMAGWLCVPQHATAPRIGDHEAAGGFAAAAALSCLLAGELDAALVLGVARDRGYAMLLVAQDGGGE
jgi:3-oxoacyl-[acyl-carrier-protein] synthase II